MIKRIIKVITAISEVDMAKWVDRGAVEDVTDYLNKNIDTFRGQNPTLTIEGNLDHIDSANGFDIWYSTTKGYFYICKESENEFVGNPKLSDLDKLEAQMIELVTMPLNENERINMVRHFFKLHRGEESDG